MLAEYENIETPIACEQDPEASSLHFFVLCGQNFFMWTRELNLFYSLVTLSFVEHL